MRAGCRFAFRRGTEVIFRVIALPIALLVPATVAVAADEETTPPATPTLEQVIVTAQRHEESLQRVPVAVTALSGAELERRQIYDVHGLQYAAPSLAIWPVVGNSMTATISMRGAYEPDLVPTNDPTVGVYVDGVYIARTTGANLDLVDMERVEVLRGPQGTLFGRNTVGGAINLVPNKPVQTFESSVQALAGNYSSVDVTGMLNVPFGGVGAMRLAAQHTGHSGYGRAVLLDRPLANDNTDFVRAQLRLLPANQWTIDLAYDLTKVDTASQLVTFVAAFPDATLIPAATGHPDDQLGNYANVTDGNVQSNRAGSFQARVWGAAATMTGIFNDFTLSLISAWRHLDDDILNTDLDGTPYDINGLVQRTQEERQFSEELQLHGLSSNRRLDWTMGSLYFTESGSLNGNNVVLAPLTEGANLVRGTAENSSAAAYLQVVGTLTPRLRATAGARYNVDWRQLISYNAHTDAQGNEFCILVPETIDQPGVCRATFPERRFDYIPWVIGLDYTPEPDTLLYGKISRGYRAGGYNMRGGTPLGFLTFGPEELLSYEVGAKSDLFSQRLRLDLAVYYAPYRNIQTGESVSDPHPAVAQVFVKLNAANAWLAGTEIETIALLGQLRLTGAFGFATGHVTEANPNAGVSVGDQVAPLTKTFSIAADLPVRLPRGELLLHVDYSGHNDDAGLVGRCFCDNSYALVNAIATFRFRQSNFEVGLWGRNLADRHSMAQSVDFGYLINEIPGDPRTFGISVSYWFGASPGGML